MDELTIVVSALGFGALLIGCLAYVLFGDDHEPHHMKDRWEP